jgi:hypothetical protein
MSTSPSPSPPEGTNPLQASLLAPETGTSRHGRAADALIASYLRELLDDDPRAQPVIARGRSAAT